MTSNIATVARLAAVFLLVVFVTGCVSTEYAGEGPLRLSPEVTELYKKYKQRSRPEVFVVSVDGRCATSTYCPGGPWNCHQNFIDYGDIVHCESVCKVPCGMLNVRGVTVWKGPVIGADGVYINK